MSPSNKTSETNPSLSYPKLAIIGCDNIGGRVIAKATTECDRF